MIAKLPSHLWKHVSGGAEVSGPVGSLRHLDRANPVNPVKVGSIESKQGLWGAAKTPHFGGSGFGRGHRVQ